MVCVALSCYKKPYLKAISLKIRYDYLTIKSLRLDSLLSSSSPIQIRRES